MLQQHGSLPVQVLLCCTSVGAPALTTTCTNLPAAVASMLCSVFDRVTHLFSRLQRTRSWRLMLNRVASQECLTGELPWAELTTPMQVIFAA